MLGELLVLRAPAEPAPFALKALWPPAVGAACGGDHVRLGPDDLVSFDYMAKSGQRRVLGISDPDVAEVVGVLKRWRGGGPELLAWKGRDGRWCDVRSPDINAYLKEAGGGYFSAKDFRTWSATVLAAVALAVSAGPPLPSRPVPRRAAHQRCSVEGEALRMLLPGSSMRS